MGLFDLDRGRLGNGLRVWAKPATSWSTCSSQARNAGASGRWWTSSGGAPNARAGREDTVFWLRLKAEDNADFSGWLAGVSLHTPGGQPAPSLFKAIDAVQPADVARVARQYSAPPSVTRRSIEQSG